MQPFPVNDPTIWTLVHMVRNFPADPRPLARLFYYLDAEHPDDLERRYIEMLAARPIMPSVWWAAWDCLAALRAEAERHFWPPEGGDDPCTV